MTVAETGCALCVDGYRAVAGTERPGRRVERVCGHHQRGKAIVGCEQGHDLAFLGLARPGPACGCGIRPRLAVIGWRAGVRAGG